MKKIVKKFLAVALISVMGMSVLPACTSSGGENGVVYVYNWGEYIDPETIEMFEEETGIHERAEKIVFTFTLASGSIAEKREVRDVLWPGNARVREILRGEEHILPDGGTVLRAGDVLTVVVTTDESEKIKDELLHIVS